MLHTYIYVSGLYVNILNNVGVAEIYIIGTIVGAD